MASGSQDDALGAQCSHDAEQGDQRQGDKHEAGPQPEPVRDGDPRSEQPRGMEQGRCASGRQAGCPEMGDSISIAPES